jgi:hypothetical protein
MTLAGRDKTDDEEDEDEDEDEDGSPVLEYDVCHTDEETLRKNLAVYFDELWGTCLLLYPRHVLMAL